VKKKLASQSASCNPRILIGVLRLVGTFLSFFALHALPGASTLGFDVTTAAGFAGNLSDSGVGGTGGGHFWPVGQQWYTVSLGASHSASAPWIAAFPVQCR
jgi:hypothetical protein